MAEYKALPLYNKIYFLIKLLYSTTRNIPKEYKYGIGNEIVALAWSCLDLFHEANNLPNREKHVAIKRLSSEFDKLKSRLRMMQEIELLTVGQFSHFQINYIIPIGEQLGGWLRWAADIVQSEVSNTCASEPG